MKQLNLFLDTNVVYDLLANRFPFYDSIAKVVTLKEKHQVNIVVSALTFVTIDYLLAKSTSASIAKEKLQMFKTLCEISSLDEEIIQKSLNSNFKDFEDAVQYFSALRSGCDVLITRNAKDFKNVLVPILTPDEFLTSISII